MALRRLSPVLLSCLCLWAGEALADVPVPTKKPQPGIKPLSPAPESKAAYSENAVGALGLNTVPSARMNPAGTITIGLGHLDPYYNGFLGFQIAEPLFISLRQTAESLKFSDFNNRLYPGLDMKLRLLSETRARPEIAVGMQSATGHRRTAGEYIAMSKRYHDFDFTAGLGWGRFASAGHLGNPLKNLNSHFGNDRSLDGESPNKPSDWFTGDEIGLFAGVEYFTPLDGLSLKFDYGADTYAAETAATGFNAPARWSAGLSYHLTQWLNIGAAMQGTDKFITRLTLKTHPGKWPHRAGEKKNAVPLRHFRTGLSLPAQMQQSAAREGLMLSNITRDTHTASAQLELAPHVSAPRQIGRAMVHMANHAGPAVEEIEIRPTMHGLQGPRVKLLRRDFEQALTRHQGSPQEIWQNAVFDAAPVNPNRSESDTPRVDLSARPQILHASLQDEFSLTEEDRGFLHRTSLILDARTPELAGLLTAGLSWRANLADNLDELILIRPRPDNPIRGDVDLYTQNTTALERSFFSLNYSLSPSFHTSFTGGYLEEMLAGFGGEMLYRPFGKRYAWGLEGWKVYKRDPLTDQSAGLTDYDAFTGHLNLWYDLPLWDTTLETKVGRFLGRDFGGSLGLLKRFDNGATLAAFLTLTDQSDPEILGGSTNAYHGIRLTLPFGHDNYTHKWADVTFKAAPLGRDTGQILDKPLPLYEATESFSKQHLAQFWGEILE